MEIIPTTITRINGFQAEIIRLQQNPSFISRILAGIHEIYQIFSLWTLGALILAFLATFTKFKLVIRRSRKVKTVLSHPSLHTLPTQTGNVDDEEYTDGDGDGDDDDSSNCSSEFESKQEDEQNRDEDFRVAGSRNSYEYQGYNLNPLTWSDFPTGRRVVKSWSGEFGLGLKLGLEKSTESLVSMWDFSDKSFFTEIKTEMLLPAVIISTGIENSKNVALRIWDTRVSRHIPEILAEWRPRWKSLSGNEDSGLANTLFSVDIRNVKKSPVNDLSEPGMLK